MSVKYFKNGKVIDLASLGGGYADLLNLFWPIGSYYETSDSNFNPNEMWGGTWTKDTAGQVLVAQDDNLFKTLGANVGADTFTLTTSQLPAHTHTYSKSATSTAAATGNTGSHTLTINEIPGHTHNIGRSGLLTTPGYGGFMQSTGVSEPFSTNSVGGGAGHTHSLNSHKHTITLTSTASGSAGSGANINKVQSSKVVIRWHRIA